MKTCSKCKETKSRIEFSKDRSKKGGRRHICRACTSAYNRARRIPPVMEGEKVCIGCLEEKPVAEFYPVPMKKDGRASHCIPCDKERNARHKRMVLDRRRRHLDRWKLSKGCQHCGRTPANGQELDLHHEHDEEKHKEVANMLSHTLKRLIAEVRKCVVLCKSCHTAEHHRLKKETGRWAPTSSRPSASRHHSSSSTSSSLPSS